MLTMGAEKIKEIHMNMINVVYDDTSTNEQLNEVLEALIDYYVLYMDDGIMETFLMHPSNDIKLYADTMDALPFTLGSYNIGEIGRKNQLFREETFRIALSENMNSKVHRNAILFEISIRPNYLWGLFLEWFDRTQNNNSNTQIKELPKDMVISMLGWNLLEIQIFLDNKGTI
jgi:hypothetical protein